MRPLKPLHTVQVSGLLLKKKIFTLELFCRGPVVEFGWPPVDCGGNPNHYSNFEDHAVEAVIMSAEPSKG